MSNAWDSLPNAKHIDRVIESIKTHSDEWTAARDMTRDAAWNAVWIAAWVAVRFAAQDAARYAAWNAVCDVTCALVAYDDCAWMLDMEYDKLRAYAILTENPAAILLLPAVKAFELIKEKENELQF